MLEHSEIVSLNSRAPTFPIAFHANLSLDQAIAKFSVNDQIANILGFVSHMVSVVTSQLVFLTLTSVERKK